MAGAINEINTNSDADTVSIKFNNASPDSQQINVDILPYSYTVKDNTYIINKHPKVSFYTSTACGYLPGKFDTSSPYTFTDDTEKVINLSETTLQTNDGELVDLTNWRTNTVNAGNLDPYDSKNYCFTDAAITYLSKVRPTSLNNWLNAKSKSISFDFTANNAYTLDLTFLNVSECTNFDYMIKYIISLIPKTKETLILDLSNWNTQKAESMSNFICFDGNRSAYQNSGSKLLINCDNVDTSNAKNLNKFLYISGYPMANGNYIESWEYKGVIDMSSCTNYREMIYIASYKEETLKKLATPIKIKNPPSSTSWWKTAGFTLKEQFEIVT